MEHLIAPRPSSPSELRRWLESFEDCREVVLSGGTYRVNTEGTQIRSSRIGNPTESTVLNQVDAEGRYGVMLQWRSELSEVERFVFDRYTMRALYGTATTLEVDYGLREHDAKALVRLLPHLIYWRWYGVSKQDDGGKDEASVTA